MAETATSPITTEGLEARFASHARAISGYYDLAEDETKSRDALIVAAVDELGLPQGQVARMAGVSRARVHQILARGAGPQG